MHDQDQTRLIRQGLWIYVIIGSASIATDLLAGRRDALLVGAWRALGILAVLIGAEVLRAWPTARMARRVTILAFAAVVAAAMPQAALSGDPFGNQLLLATVCLAVAVFMPWRWQDQLAFAGIGVAGVVGNWLVAGGELFLAFDTILCCIASVPVVLFLERERTALAETRALAAASEARLRQIADNAHEVFWTLELRDGGFTELSYVSPAARALLGLEPGAMGKAALLARIHPEDAARLGELFDRAEHVQAHGAVDFRILSPAGELRHVQARFTPIRDAAGRLVRLGGVLEDVTTERLAAAALARARDEAETTARVRSQFLVAMSHEISTPLTAILGTLELLRDTGATAEQRRRWGIVRAGAQSLHLLLSDALDFSKSELGELQLRPAPLDLGEVVAGIVELHAAPARARRLDLRFAWRGPLLVGASGDADRLRQVLNNLVSNAIKFTPAGEVCVEAAPCRTAPDAIRFAVTDTGIGVSVEVRRRIFQPFTQADESIASRYGGTGLGLAIARRLVRLMGGQIGVDSGAAGSTFWFTLPLAAPDAGPTPAELGGRRLLVVAADAGHRAALAEALAARGATTVTAAGIDGARAALRGRPPCDAVVLVGDARLAAPDLLVGGGVPPTVVLATAGRASDAAAAVEAGAVAWLAAPLRPSTLAARVRECWAPVEEPAIGLRPQAPRCRVLVVDDSEIVRQVTADLLCRMGHDAEAAGGGAAALEALRRRPFDLVLLDCQMPDMDGFETARRIRAAEAGAPNRVAIVAFSGGAPELYRDRCLAAGMDDCLAKPVDAAALDAMLARWSEPPAPPLAAADGVERARLGELAGHDPAAVRRYGELFLHEGRELLGHLAAAAAGAPSTELPALVHRARGAATTVGAAGVERVLARFGRSPAGLDDLVADLRRALDAFEAALGELEGELLRGTAPPPAA